MVAQQKIIRVRTAKRKGKSRVWKKRKITIHHPDKPKKSE